MSDVSKYLPLSQRGSGGESRDESGVSSDWSPHLATTLLALAQLLDGLPGENWESPTLREGYTVQDAAGHLLWRLGTPRAARWRELLQRVVRGPQMPHDAILGLSRAAVAGAATSGYAAAGGIRSLAGSISTAQSRRGIADLSVAVVDGLDIARSVGLTLRVDPVALGAVALARSLSAPTPIRAVVRGRSLVPTDADWVVGRGPTIEGTAADIVLFLWGRAGVPRGEPESTPPEKLPE